MRPIVFTFLFSGLLFIPEKKKIRWLYAKIKKNSIQRGGIMQKKNNNKKTKIY